MYFWHRTNRSRWIKIYTYIKFSMDPKRKTQMCMRKQENVTYDTHTPSGGIKFWYLIESLTIESSSI